MGKTYEEMKDFLVGRDAQRNAARFTQLRAHVEVGKVMSELIADPRWELYCRHLEDLRSREQAKIDILISKLNDGPVVAPEIYAQQKAELAGAKKYVLAMTQAINMAAQLIENGEEAMKAVGN